MATDSNTRSVSALQVDENPSAFPHQPMGSDGLPEVEAHYGMTLRDWFAGQAIAASDFMNATGWTHLELAQYAYSVADAMLAARKSAA